MKINLEDWLGEAFVTYETDEGKSKECEVKITRNGFGFHIFDPKGTFEVWCSKSPRIITSIRAKINLENYLNKRVIVKLRCCSFDYCGVIEYDKVYASYLIRDGKVLIGRDYCDSGLNKINPDVDIIHIKEINTPMTNQNQTQSLRDQIKATQEQLNKLQKEFEKAQRDEEFYTPILVDNNYTSALNLIKTKQTGYLLSSFSWRDTPQGEEYWRAKRDCNSLTEEDYTLIRKWIVNYLIKLNS